MSDISVIIPTWQHASTLTECIEHILGQTLKPKEIIVVDDGSTDNTQEMLKPFVDREEIVLHTQKNLGSNPARNKGFDLSSGAFVLFLDADVIMEKTMLEELSSALKESPEKDYAYCSFKFGWKKFSSFPFDAERLKKMNYIHTSALIRRKQFPRFDENIKRFQDWDLWLTMLSRGSEGVFVPAQLFKVLQEKSRSGIAISSWRPSFYYRLPWKKFGKSPAAYEKYENAREILLKKHGLWTSV